LALRNRVFQVVRELPYSVVVVDGGDFEPARKDSHRVEIAQFLLEGMGAMHYDAIGVGEMDLAMGPAYLHEALGRLPLVGANVRFGPALAESLPAVRWVEVKGKRVAITAVLDPVLYFESPGAFSMTDSLMVGDATQGLRNAMAQIGDTADVVVALIHADRMRAIEILRELSDLPRAPDVAVIGHQPLGPRAEEKVDRTFVLQPGPRSQEISLFTLSYGDSATVVRTSLQVYRLATLPGGDPTLDAMTRTFLAKHGLQ
jgi:2',3'-cyclic-nucleotide 2'-phosphodiesterase (5'-nucleotidase family)